ncbi:hypothetical protein [Halovivax limisalsi]|uniref:hypothetical protein n=1 Tax=Halovivax limisalsi TaxID=1453760 RepID=UPI001FFC98C3|nr:hypothetical protein [Halovivax limisalsi]
MSKKNVGKGWNRRSVLRRTGLAAGSVSLIGQGSASAIRGGDGSQSKETAHTANDSDEKQLLTTEERQRFSERLKANSIEPATLQISQKRNTGGEYRVSEVDPLQEDPTDTPGEIVWEDTAYRKDDTAIGNTIVEADYYLVCYKTDIMNDVGHRYYILYGWAGCRPQEHALWTGNLKEAYIEYEFVGGEGDMKRYKPGGDRNKHGIPMTMSMTVSGESGGIGGSATLSGEFTIGGGTVRPHRSRMNMSNDRFNVIFEGSTEATCEVMGMCAYTRPEDVVTEWDYNLGIDGERWNKE